MMEKSINIFFIVVVLVNQKVKHVYQIQHIDIYLSIYYFLKCKWNDFGKFVNILKEVDERLKSVLGLELTVKSTIYSEKIRKFLIYGAYVRTEELLDHYNLYYTNRIEKEEKIMKDFYLLL